jgi:hypothetical protein
MAGRVDLGSCRRPYPQGRSLRSDSGIERGPPLDNATPVRVCQLRLAHPLHPQTPDHGCWDCPPFGVLKQENVL